VPVPYRRQDAESFVALATDALQQGRGAHLLVERDGTVVGCVGAGIDPTDQLAVVGYWTDPPEARRQGITTTAMRRLCQWLLDEVGMPAANSTRPRPTPAPTQLPNGSASDSTAHGGQRCCRPRSAMTPPNVSTPTPGGYCRASFADPQPRVVPSCGAVSDP
jgi:hypothetical protein